MTRTRPSPDRRSPDRPSPDRPNSEGPSSDGPKAEHAARSARGRPGRGYPPLTLFPTTFWSYPSQHYDAYVDPEGRVVKSAIRHDPAAAAMQGDKAYAGATPSWVVWQLLTRYTRAGDLVVDPMCGSGTTIDVARDLSRRGLGYDLAPSRPDILRADARRLPLEDAKADFVFIDPPYSTHLDYSDDPACIGKLDAAGPGYAEAMGLVFAEADRVMRPRRYMAVFVSDSWRKRSGAGRGEQGADPRGARRGGPAGGPATLGGEFLPLGFELFGLLRDRFTPVDIVCVARKSRTVSMGNRRKAAVEGNFFIRGFSYLFIMKKGEG